MLVKARFIGTNSLGYQNGLTYELLIFGTSIKRRHDGSGECKYDTLHSFISNWDSIVHLN